MFSSQPLLYGLEALLAQRLHALAIMILLYLCDSHIACTGERIYILLLKTSAKVPGDWPTACPPPPMMMKVRVQYVPGTFPSDLHRQPPLDAKYLSIAVGKVGGVRKPLDGAPVKFMKR